MKKQLTRLIVLTLVFVHFALPQERIDESVLARIKTEGFQNSKALETLAYLTDVFGARLTGSPKLKAAQAWTRDTMASWGLSNAHLEPWGTFPSSWNIERFSAEMTAPTYDRLNVYPLAWSPSTNGTISGTPTIVNIRSKADFDKYRGKLKGAIVFRGTFERPTPESRFATPAKRFSDDELKKSAAATDPTGEGINDGAVKDFWDEEESWNAGLAAQNDIISFLRSEGIAALVQPSSRSNGILSVQGFYRFDPAQNVPAFVMSREQYARIIRLTQRNIPVKLELNLQASAQPGGAGNNVIAEIPGTDPKLKDEVVMLGGHFDSWHSATGAIDNGVGCVAMMEAMRILKAINAKPRRTIRIALWEGEEQDYYGSLGYVKTHFGDPATMKLLPEHEKLSAYYNLDNGTGKIRGVFLQGNEAARPIFEAFLKPFAYLGAGTLTILNTGGTDHLVFDAVGLPGFQFIQDPIDYNTRIHHTNLDVMEGVIEDDLKTDAVIIASLAYFTAMRDEKMPRKALPKPHVPANP
jgi:hypothetical protein